MSPVPAVLLWRFATAGLMREGHYSSLYELQR